MARHVWLTKGVSADPVQANVNKFYAAVAASGGKVIDTQLTGGEDIVIMVTYEAEQEVTIEPETRKPPESVPVAVTPKSRFRKP